MDVSVFFLVVFIVVIVFIVVVVFVGVVVFIVVVVVFVTYYSVICIHLYHHSFFKCLLIYYNHCFFLFSIIITFISIILFSSYNCFF